jgi:hypothetical protein
MMMTMTWWSDLFVVSSMNCNNYLVVVNGLRNNYVDELCCFVMRLFVSYFGGSPSGEAAKICNIYKKTNIFVS